MTRRDKKHRPFTSGQYDAARRWGLKNGYCGIKNGGGWIYGPNNEIACQGWGQIWHAFGARIEADQR